jgi:hypothetical protein
MMKYMFKNHLYAQAGIQLGLRYKGSDEFLNTITDKEDLSYKVDIKDQYHPLDGGLCAGLGYRLTGGNGMNIGLQYYYGLVDVRISDASPDEFNRTLYVNVGIPIGKGKRRQQQVKTNKTFQLKLIISILLLHFGEVTIVCGQVGTHSKTCTGKCR